MPDPAIDARYYLRGPLTWRTETRGSRLWVEALDKHLSVLALQCDVPTGIALRDELLRVFPLSAPVETAPIPQESP